MKTKMNRKLNPHFPALRSALTAVSGGTRQKQIHSSSMKGLLFMPLLLVGTGLAHAATHSATMNSFYSYQCNFDNQSVSSWTTYGGAWSIIDQNSSYYYRVDSSSCDKAVTIVPTMTDFTVEGIVQIRNSTGQGSLIFGVSVKSFL